MFDTLKGPALYAATAILLALVGAVTFLVADGDLTGSDALIVFTPILTGVIGLGAAHVAGQTVAAAVNVPPPATVPPAASVGTPGAGPAAPVA